MKLKAGRQLLSDLTVDSTIQEPWCSELHSLRKAKLAGQLSVLEATKWPCGAHQLLPKRRKDLDFHHVEFLGWGIPCSQPTDQCRNRR